MMQEPGPRTQGLDGDGPFPSRLAKAAVLAGGIPELKRQLFRVKAPFTFPYMTLMFSKLWLLEPAAQVGEAPHGSGDTRHPAGTGRIRRSGY